MAILLVFLFAGLTVQAQVKAFNGFVRNTNDYCAPITTKATTITITEINGSPATNLQTCSRQAITGNTIPAQSGYFCFKGASAAYDLTFTTSGNPLSAVKYRWVSEEGRTPGVYELREFGGDSSGQTDSTYALKSAAAYIGSQQYEGNQGGILNMSNGFFVLSDPQNLLPVVLPSGMTIKGINGKLNLSSSRLQLTVANKTVLKIGGCTNNVSLRDVGLLSTSDSGTRALVAEGYGSQSSQNFVFSSLVIQGFDKGLEVLGLDPDKSWQFDTVKFENSTISAKSFAIHLDTINQDWEINNSLITVGQGGTALLIDRVGVLNISNLYGGGPPNNGTINPNNLAKAFIWFRGDARGGFQNVGYHSSINIQGSQCENTQHSILYDLQTTLYDYLRAPVKLTHSAFGDPIKLRANVVLISIGNNYASNTVRTVRPGDPSETGPFPGSTKSRIHSSGDQFAYLTSDLHSCPPFQTGFPPETADLQKCVRDFIIDNSNGGQNRVVTRSAQVSSPNLLSCDPNNGSNCGDFSKYNTLYNRMESTLENAGDILPSADNQFEMGNNSKRWKLVRGVTVINGDTILSDKVPGKELYKIHEDEENIFFSDIRTGGLLMRLDRKGNLFVTGTVTSGAAFKQQKANGSTPKSKGRKTRPN